MRNIGYLSQLRNQRHTPARLQRAASATIVALLFGTAAAVAQDAKPAPAPEAQMSIPSGYTAHHSVDLGGRMTNLAGSGSMYDTLINLQSGPRVQGESFEMHALPGNKKSLVDDLSAFGSGFGGDPNILARVTASKAKQYEFTGVFRRDRLYSNYDLLANPNLPATGLLVDVGSSSAPVSQLNWAQMSKASSTSPVMFNTVRRMTDTNLTLKPFSTFSYRLGYSHSTMEGPALSPSYNPFGMKYNALLRQYQRNGSDDFLGAIDWKPSPATKVTLEVQANHYKFDTFMTLDPSGFVVQEADGTPAYLGNYTSFTPYGVAACNTGSMGAGNYTSAAVYTMLSPANTPGGKPIINPACAVMTSYLRTAQNRVWTPTETVRFQSSALKNIAMNGNVHYTLGTMNMPNYYEGSWGLNGAVRSAVSTGGYAVAHRDVLGADYGIVWQVAPKVSIGDRIDFTSIHQPGYGIIPSPATLSTPAAPNQTITYSGTLTPGTGTLPHGVENVLTPNYFGQESLFNNLTVSWDATDRARFALTYRVGNRKIGQGAPHTGELQETDPVSGELTINENAGIFNAALRPASNWDLNGTIELSYDDNVLTPVAPRQSQIYRVHSLYKPNKITTISMSYSDRERHNNTNNAQDLVAEGTVYNGPINHVDYSRVGSVGVILTPSERYSVDVNYSYSDVYTATNTCFTNGAAAPITTQTPNVPGIAGAAPITSSGAASLCKPTSATAAPEWAARDFSDAPTNFVSAALSYNATDKIQSNFGYTISKVDGSRFFPDARDVNGSLVSKYQTPFVNLAYTMHPGLIWKAEYNYYGYGEGGPSGAQYCSTTPVSQANSATIGGTIVPCAGMSVPTGMNEGTAGAVAPRVFHANNVTLGIHYEF